MPGRWPLPLLDLLASDRRGVAICLDRCRHVPRAAWGCRWMGLGGWRSGHEQATIGRLRRYLYRATNLYTHKTPACDGNASITDQDTRFRSCQADANPAAPRADGDTPTIRGTRKRRRL